VRYSEFLQEAIGPENGGHVGTKDLERDEAVVLQVAGEVHRSHTPPAEFSLEEKSIVDGLSQRRRQRHIIPSGRKILLNITDLKNE
jgi:hypothetical protein